MFAAFRTPLASGDKKSTLRCFSQFPRLCAGSKNLGSARSEASEKLRKFVLPVEFFQPLTELGALASRWTRASFAPEGEMIFGNIHCYAISIAEFSVQNFQAERVEDLSLDDTPEGTGAVCGVVALFG